MSLPHHRLRDRIFRGELRAIAAYPLPVDPVLLFHSIY